ncbi:MAG TPA: 1,2-phenylacetyl-CoA epoxidase subunit PaaD [Bacillota bacterium]|nr:1,2-phenylacetyl-CoA epoxidase subunit PaaD [Bacillota bacterium]
MTKEEVHDALTRVMDPEIPTISIVDLGMVEDVQVEAGQVHVALLPTFLGCPALDLIEEAVRKQLGAGVVVRFRHDPPWGTHRISEAGKQALRRFGIAPPEDVVHCPRCGTEDVLEENLFGPTRCRSIFYCRKCRSPFEAFKAI